MILQDIFDMDFFTSWQFNASIREVFQTMGKVFFVREWLNVSDNSLHLGVKSLKKKQKLQIKISDTALNEILSALLRQLFAIREAKFFFQKR